MVECPSIGFQLDIHRSVKVVDTDMNIIHRAMAITSPISPSLPQFESRKGDF